MKRLRTKFTSCLLALLCITTLTACDEDWWFDTGEVVGEWRIVEITGVSHAYQHGDYWHFYSDGYFTADGFNLGEQGYWDASGRRIYFTFNHYGDTEMEAYIRNFEGDYMVLRVTDYTYGDTYTLRLIRTSYF